MFNILESGYNHKFQSEVCEALDRIWLFFVFFSHNNDFIRNKYKLILLESLLFCDFSGLCDSALLVLFLVLIDLNS